jgi:hypothetical protein
MASVLRDKNLKNNSEIFINNIVKGNQESTLSKTITGFFRKDHVIYDNPKALRYGDSSLTVVVSSQRMKNGAFFELDIGEDSEIGQIFLCYKKNSDFFAGSYILMNPVKVNNITNLKKESLNTIIDDFDIDNQGNLLEARIKKDALIYPDDLCFFDYLKKKAEEHFSHGLKEIDSTSRSYFIHSFVEQNPHDIKNDFEVLSKKKRYNLVLYCKSGLSGLDGAKEISLLVESIKKLTDGIYNHFNTSRSFSGSDVIPSSITPKLLEQWPPEAKSRFYDVLQNRKYNPN